ncbi:pyridoxamine 5'-phosphate oxidase family protein [Maridesulfovibrio sp.]|uniref:pyridoxamine 5'-phosphate oxidase family protein n=1 Tax=Maridesulfovibrio sp. TaxID=2795000 RepID=UPI0029F57E77|nr:pyridoxamine 5'-phosphate oxidase family protein [Maridesulfovibrio sp.]
MTSEKQLKTCLDLIHNSNILVLATQGEDGVHTSLMAYAGSDDGSEIYMISSKNSRKWQNITRNPQVSMLIDDREGKLGVRRSQIKALTVKGTFIPITAPAERAAVYKLITDAVPEITSAFSENDNEIIRIKTESLLLLDGPKDSYYCSISS